MAIVNDANGSWHIDVNLTSNFREFLYYILRYGKEIMLKCNRIHKLFYVFINYYLITFIIVMCFHHILVYSIGTILQNISYCVILSSS